MIELKGFASTTSYQKPGKKYKVAIFRHWVLGGCQNIIGF
jgi:hypothetical protein